MYKITLNSGSKGAFYTVAHYVEGDPHPTTTETIHDGRPEAWKEALGRAAKLCIVQASAGLTYQDVMVDDGRIYRVRVEQIK